MPHKKPESRFKGLLEYRCIGPFRGGRVVAVAGDPTNPAVFYFGAVAGGVWKTKDAGAYWECVSDGFFNTASVGALAVSESDPNVLYAGTGETTIRIDVSHGDGVYKSTDGGNNWTHVGLEDTRHIAKSRFIPTIPIWFMWRRWDMLSVKTNTAAYTAPTMVANTGNRCCSAARKLARLT